MSFADTLDKIFHKHKSYYEQLCETLIDIHKNKTSESTLEKEITQVSIHIANESRQLTEFSFLTKKVVEQNEKLRHDSQIHEFLDSLINKQFLVEDLQIDLQKYLASEEEQIQIQVKELEKINQTDQGIKAALVNLDAIYNRILSHIKELESRYTDDTTQINNILAQLMATIKNTYTNEKQDQSKDAVLSHLLILKRKISQLVLPIKMIIRDIEEYQKLLRADLNDIRKLEN